MKENIKEAKELLIKYKSLTLEQITECFDKLKDTYNTITGYLVMRELTGFGTCYTCSLCKVINSNCDICIYSIYSVKEEYSCVNESYYLIAKAKTPDRIFYGVQKRIEFLENTIKLCEK